MRPGRILFSCQSCLFHLKDPRTYAILFYFFSCARNGNAINISTNHFNCVPSLAWLGAWEKPMFHLRVICLVRVILTNTVVSPS